VRLPWLSVAYALALACGSPGEGAEPDPATGPTDTRADDPGVGPASEPAAAPDGGPGDQGAQAPYDRAVQKSTHNAYDRDEPLFDQLAWHRVRSVELDIHLAKSGNSAGPGEFFVYHDDKPFFRDTSCTMFSDCLAQIAAFHRAVPQHEVVTLWVDLKDDFAPAHMPADVDAAITEALGRAAIVAPQDLVARCPGAATIRGAVTGPCGFPSLGELRGKVLVAVTGGTQCDAASHVSAYAAPDATARLAFVAPDIDATCDAVAYDALPSVVFVNMPFAERARAGDARSRGLVARIYKGGLPGGLDNASDFSGARAAGAQHLATDKVNADEDLFATTASPLGFPLACDDCAPPRREVASLIGMRAQSGDIFDDRDSFYFASEVDASASPVAWSAFVSVPSSHVEEFAKACLMARASDAPGAANVALCRTFDKHPPRFQVRAASDALTTTSDMPDPAGVSAESPAFLRLTLTPKGATTEAHGEASLDGVSWTTVGKTTVPGALPQRGLATASHGGAARVKALFGNLVKTRGGTSTAYRSAELPAQRAVGAGASGDAFDGVVP
jgi:hypothetical protein